MGGIWVSYKGMKRVIIAAGDLGLSPQIDKGILEGAKSGIISATSVLVTGRKAFGLRQLSKLGVSLGLQLNLTLGMPLSGKSARSLLNPRKKEFWRSGREVIRAGKRKAIQTEFLTQLRRAKALFGPTWITTHDYISLHPSLFEILLEIAQEEGLAVRALAPWQIEPIREAGLWCPDHISSAFREEPGITVGGLLEILDSLEEGTTDLLCHPGFLPKDLLGKTSYTWQRDIELSTLTNEKIRERLTLPESPITLTGFSPQ